MSSARERWLLADHAERLSDAELLAACLAGGGVPLAERLLMRFGSLCGVLGAPPARLLAERGLGPGRAAALKGALALAERAAAEDLTRGPAFPDAAAVRRYLALKLAPSEREVFVTLFLDARHRLLRFDTLFLGTIDSANVHPREVLKRCLKENAAAVIVAHNHPSGIAEPSQTDLALTSRLQSLLLEIGVRLLDHLIIGRGGACVSLAERGHL